VPASETALDEYPWMHSKPTAEQKYFRPPRPIPERIPGQPQVVDALPLELKSAPAQSLLNEPVSYEYITTVMSLVTTHGNTRYLLSITGVQYCQANDVSAIFSDQYIIIRFDRFAGSLRSTETHIQHIGFLIIVKPNMLRWQLQHISSHYNTLADEVLSSFCYCCCHITSPFGRFSHLPRDLSKSP